MKPFDFTLNQDEKTRLDQLKAFLEQCKLSKYYKTFVSEGFDSLLSLFDITEADLIALNVKRGHRRVIQRAIATARGIPLSTPIVIYYGYEEPGVAHMPKPGTKIVDNTISTTTTTTTTTFITTNNDNSTRKDAVINTEYYYPRGTKRYRHGSGKKKRKQYVPSKPVTPFDEYLHELKTELSSASAAELTETAQERWNLLSPVEKERYEREALHANSDYVLDKFIIEDDSDQSQNSIDFPT